MLESELQRKDDQFGRIAKGGEEDPADLFSGILGNVLNRGSDKRSERKDAQVGDRKQQQGWSVEHREHRRCDGKDEQHIEPTGHGLSSCFSASFVEIVPQQYTMPGNPAVSSKESLER